VQKILFGNKERKLLFKRLTKYIMNGKVINVHVKIVIWIFVSLPNISVETLMISVMVLGQQDFGR
jgi:hypothetical protein